MWLNGGQEYGRIKVPSFRSINVIIVLFILIVNHIFLHPPAFFFLIFFVIEIIGTRNHFSFLAHSSIAVIRKYLQILLVSLCVILAQLFHFQFHYFMAFSVDFGRICVEKHADNQRLPVLTFDFVS